MARAPWYCWREDVADVLDAPTSPLAYRAIDRAIGSATETVRGLLKRSFVPEIDVRSFDWPSLDPSHPWRLWLGKHELVSLTSVTSGGVSIPLAAVDLRPEGGPPFNELQVLLDSGSALSSGSTWQDAIDVAGVFGYRADEVDGGTLAFILGGAVTDRSVLVSNGAAVGVGAILRIGSERVNVVDRAWNDSGQNVAGAGLSESMADRALTVSGGTFFAGEKLLVGTERLEVTDVAGSVLTVNRAVDGTVLAAHAAAVDIYVSRTLTIDRAYLGSTVAAHASSDPIAVHDIPALVRELTVAEAVAEIEQSKSGWARTVGSGETEREAAGRGVAQIRRAALATYKRGPRKKAV